VRKKKQALGNGLTSLSQTTNAEASEDESVNGDVDEAGVEHDTVDGEVANGTAEVEEEEEEEEDDGWGDEMAKEFEEEMRKAQQSEEQGEG